MISSRAPFLNQSTNPVTIETENIDDDLGSSSKATDYKTKTHALIAKRGKYTGINLHFLEKLERKPNCFHLDLGNILPVYISVSFGLHSTSYLQPYRSPVLQKKTRAHYFQFHRFNYAVGGCEFNNGDFLGGIANPAKSTS